MDSCTNCFLVADNRDAGTVSALLSKPEGGEAWLMELRELPYSVASKGLRGLPGVGPKVAACVCLFSLDKHAAVPVDTHIWQVCTMEYWVYLQLIMYLHCDIMMDRFSFSLPSIDISFLLSQLAQRDYSEILQGRKTLTEKLMFQIESEFISIFGPYAGWALGMLFIAELATFRNGIPENLRPPQNKNIKPRSALKINM